MFKGIGFGPDPGPVIGLCLGTAGGVVLELIPEVVGIDVAGKDRDPDDGISLHSGKYPTDGYVCHCPLFVDAGLVFSRRITLDPLFSSADSILTAAG